jgi:hypothetical protein
MTCKCGNVALWYVGSNGFCRAHKTEAYQAAAEAKQLQQSVAGLLALDHQRRVRDTRELASGR